MLVTFAGGGVFGYVYSQYSGAGPVTGREAFESTLVRAGDVKIDHFATHRRRINTALDEGHYREATAMLADAVTRHSREEVAQLGQLFLYQGQRLDLSGAKSTAVDLIEGYVRIVPDDVDAYVLLAAFHVRQERYDQALRAMAGAVAAETVDQGDRYLSEFNHLLYTHVRRAAERPGGLDLELLDHLAGMLPGHEPLQLEIARAYVQVRDFGLASAALQNINPDGALSLQRERLALQIEREIEYDDPFESFVALQKIGRHFLVAATLVNDYDELDVALIIDTGASMSLITPEIAEMLDIDIAALDQVQRLNTPGGHVMAPIYQVDALVVGREMIYDVPLAIVSLESGGHRVDGLIGMDFLERFEFQIDQNTQELLLRRR